MQDLVRELGGLSQQDVDELTDTELVTLAKELLAKLPRKKYDHDKDWKLQAPIHPQLTNKDPEVEAELERRRILNRSLPSHQRLTVKRKRVIRIIRERKIQEVTQ